MATKKFALNSLLLLGFQIILIIGLTNSFTYIWGRLHPRNVRLFEIEFRVKRDNLIQPFDDNEDSYLEIEYPEEGLQNEFVITMIMVSSSKKTPLDNRLYKDESSATIIDGGVGLNHTTIRLNKITVESTYNFVIYGMHRNSYVELFNKNDLQI